MNKTIFIAAMLAVTTVLAAGLTVLPSTVQEAQANPCSTEIESETNIDSEGNAQSSIASSVPSTGNDNRECNFVGPVELDED